MTHISIFISTTLVRVTFSSYHGDWRIFHIEVEYKIIVELHLDIYFNLLTRRSVHLFISPCVWKLALVSAVAWWQLWNFVECHTKFNRFLYPNEHIQRIFWYLVRLFESELSKIGNFQSSESFFEAKFHSIFLGVIFFFKHQSRRTTFNKNICNWNHSQESLFGKNVP